MSAPTGEEASLLPGVSFPPRNEPFDFRQQLDRKYRDGLRRTPVDSYVDLEGDIVWTQEYLRYRVNGCTHTESVERVFTQIDGGRTAPVCRVPPQPRYTVTPAQRRVGPDASGAFNAYVEVSSFDTEYTITSDRSWLNVYYSRARGSGLIYYYVSRNPDATEREGHITIAGLSGLYPPAVHTVVQSGR